MIWHYRRYAQGAQHRNENRGIFGRAQRRGGAAPLRPNPSHRQAVGEPRVPHLPTAGGSDRRPLRQAVGEPRVPRMFTSVIHAAAPHNARMKILLFLGELRPPKPSRGRAMFTLGPMRGAHNVGMKILLFLGGLRPPNPSPLAGCFLEGLRPPNPPAGGLFSPQTVMRIAHNAGMKIIILGRAQPSQTLPAGGLFAGRASPSQTLPRAGYVHLSSRAALQRAVHRPQRSARSRTSRQSRRGGARSVRAVR